MDRAVVNSTCVMALERIGRLDILATSYTEVLAPPAVQDEVGGTIEGVIIRAPSDPGVVLALETQLGRGEASAIALAMEIPGAVLLLDEKKARRVAQQLGLRITGTLGLILCAKRRGFLPAVRPILDELERVGFRMTRRLRLEALRLSGEETS
ncbi:MAG: DUF3368 domain-containing protein [Planctomycetota bacterium]